MSGFYDSVYEIVAKIPPGRVATFGQIARMLGRPRMARFVGYASNNQKSWNLPWHRVVFKDGSICSEQFFEQSYKALKAEGYRIFAVEQVEGSLPLQDFEFEPNTAYLLGNEVEGVSEEALPYCEGAIELPQEGTKHSINVSVCAGIVMWKAFEHLFLKPKKR